MLILCEKSSVAQSFANAFNAEKKAGYYQNGNTVITYCVGHLYELEEPDYYLPAGTDKHDITYLPIIPDHYVYHKKEKVIKQTKVINELLKTHQGEEIIVATDADREGEVIARIVLKESHAKIDYSKCKRFWTSENLTPEIIKETIAKMKPLKEYDFLAAQGFARQHADWLTGMNLSRYVSFGNSANFSVGRVQTAILAAIAKRNKDIENFIPQKYYELKVTITDKNGNKAEAYLLNPATKKTAFETNENLGQIQKEIISSQLTVKYQTVEKRIMPPHLLSFTALAKIAADKYDYSTQETLEYAQNLYEKHECLSYPRTEGTVMGGEEGVKAFKDAFELVKGLSEISKLCDTSLISTNNTRIFNPDKIKKYNHHALLPTKPIPDSATEGERNVYNIVLKIFLQSIMKDFVYDELQMMIFAGKYILKSSVKTIKQLGWKESEKDEELKSYSAGFDPESVRIINTEILEKYTQPKKQYTESSLLAFMENPTGETAEEKLVGLGTEATRGAIIQKLFNTGYCEKKKKNFLVTAKGFYLLNLLMKDDDLKQIANIGQTTKWERMLNEDPRNFENTINEYVRKCIKPKEKENMQKYEYENFGSCPLCGKGKIYRNKYKYYCSSYKEGCKFGINYHICEAPILPSDIKLMLEGKLTNVKRMKGKNGNQFPARVKMIIENNEVKTELVFEKSKKSS